MAMKVLAAIAAAAAGVAVASAYKDEVWDHNKRCVQFQRAAISEQDDGSLLNVPEGFVVLNSDLEASTTARGEGLICREEGNYGVALDLPRIGNTVLDGNTLRCTFGSRSSSAFAIALASEECEV